MRKIFANMALAAALMAAIGCGTVDDPGLNAGVGGTGGSASGTGGSSAACTAGQTKSVACPDGTSSGCTCTCQCANGSCYWSSASYPAGTGGSTASAIQAPAKPTTVCGNLQTVDSTSVTVNGYSFTRDWIAGATSDGRCIKVNPVWPFANSAAQCVSAPSPAAIYVYDLTNDSGGIVDASPAKGTLIGKTSAVTSQGYVYCPGDYGAPAGNIHFNLVANDSWMMINGAANAGALPRSSQLFVEKSQKPVTEPGSLGMVAYWNGSSVTVAPTYGGDYRSQ